MATQFQTSHDLFIPKDNLLLKLIKHEIFYSNLSSHVGIFFA